MEAFRSLLVVADDFGIGRATSRGILALAERGRISAAALLVNSPDAEESVAEWRRSGIPLEIGWHPCLTLDEPILPPQRVPSLVDVQGQFLSLSRFLGRLFLGIIRPTEVHAELQAQFDRFAELIGRPPRLVSSHHHVQIFAPVGDALLDILSRQSTLPYFRRIVEPWQSLLRVPGSRCKRAILSRLGRRFAQKQIQAGFPGNDFLAGLTRPERLSAWLRCTPGQVVEWVCHPGFADPALAGREDVAREAIRRPRELDLLQGIDFVTACGRADFALASVSEIIGWEPRGLCHAA